MTEMQQRAQLHRQIWKIADEVRGAVDGWDFKQYVLGTLFYRFISENFTDYMQAGDSSIDYAAMPDSIITPEIKDDAVKVKGYFIYPGQLFCNIAAEAHQNEELNTKLKEIFTAIESSASGYPSEQGIKGLFDDFDPPAAGSAAPLPTKTNALPPSLKAWRNSISAILKTTASTFSVMPTNT